MNFDAVGRETVFQKFVAHEGGDDAHAIEALVDFDFAKFIAQADEFYWKFAAVIAGDKSAAAEDAQCRGCARTNLSREDSVFVTAHAVDVVIVNHAGD